jgi:hypothetical protein
MNIEIPITVVRAAVRVSTSHLVSGVAASEAMTMNGVTAI